jgi:hypothetical protein
MLKKGPSQVLPNNSILNGLELLTAGRHVDGSRVLHDSEQHLSTSPRNVVFQKCDIILGFFIDAQDDIRCVRCLHTERASGRTLRVSEHFETDVKKDAPIEGFDIHSNILHVPQAHTYPNSFQILVRKVQILVHRWRRADHALHD